MIKLFLSNRRLAISALTSITVHASAGAILFVGLSGDLPAEPPAAMVLEFASLPSAPPAPPSLAPPTPEQKKVQPKPKIAELNVPSIPKLLRNVKPPVVVPVREPEKPTQDREQEDKPDRVTTRQAAPEAPNKGLAKAPNMGAPSQSTSKAEQSWESKVLAALERKKKYPEAAQRNHQEDVVYVMIVIDRDGHVISSDIRRSRGIAQLNQEVISLVRRASPLPRPPESIPGDQIDLLVPVEFFIKNYRR